MISRAIHLINSQQVIQKVLNDLAAAQLKGGLDTGKLSSTLSDLSSSDKLESGKNISRCRRVRTLLMRLEDQSAMTVSSMYRNILGYVSSKFIIYPSMHVEMQVRTDMDFDADVRMRGGHPGSEGQ